MEPDLHPGLDYDPALLDDDKVIEPELMEPDEFNTPLPGEEE